jgi:hypothetical protein
LHTVGPQCLNFVPQCKSKAFSNCFSAPYHHILEYQLLIKEVNILFGFIFIWGSSHPPLHMWDPVTLSFLNSQLFMIYTLHIHCCVRSHQKWGVTWVLHSDFTTFKRKHDCYVWKESSCGASQKPFALFVQS